MKRILVSLACITIVPTIGMWLSRSIELGAGEKQVLLLQCLALTIGPLFLPFKESE